MTKDIENILYSSSERFSADVQEWSERDNLTFLKVNNLLVHYKGKWKSKHEDIVIFEDGSKAELIQTTQLFKVI